MQKVLLCKTFGTTYSFPLRRRSASATRRRNLKPCWSGLSKWRPTKATSGCVVDVPSGETVARGFSKPHSPRLYRGQLWVLDSGKGQFVSVDPQTGKTQTIVEVPGYTRGLAFSGQFAFVGLSRIRETSIFGGLPIAERRDELRCGVAVVDLNSGQAVAKFEFQSGVDEIFSVAVLPATRNAAVFGPSPDEDQQRDVWIVPATGRDPPFGGDRPMSAVPRMS